MRFAIATLFAASATATSHETAACTTFKTTAKLTLACTDDPWACSCTGAPAAGEAACTLATTDALKKAITDAVATTS